MKYREFLMNQEASSNVLLIDSRGDQKQDTIARMITVLEERPDDFSNWNVRKNGTNNRFIVEKKTGKAKLNISRLSSFNFCGFF